MCNRVGESIARFVSGRFSSSHGAAREYLGLGLKSSVVAGGPVMRIAESLKRCAPFIALFAISERVGIVVPHSKRKERVLNGAQSIEGEPRVKRHDRANCHRERIPG